MFGWNDELSREQTDQVAAAKRVVYDGLLQAIERALRETDGNKAKTARRLGLTRTQLYVRLRKYDIEPPAAV